MLFILAFNFNNVHWYYVIRACVLKTPFSAPKPHIIWHTWPSIAQQIKVIEFIVVAHYCSFDLAAVHPHHIVCNGRIDHRITSSLHINPTSPSNVLVTKKAESVITFGPTRTCPCSHSGQLVLALVHIRAFEWSNAYCTVAQAYLLVDKNSRKFTFDACLESILNKKCDPIQIAFSKKRSD